MKAKTPSKTMRTDLHLPTPLSTLCYSLLSVVGPRTQMPTSPSTRNIRLFKEPILVPGRMTRLSSHTHDDDDGVPPIMTASFSRPFSPGGIPDGLPVVAEEAPSSNASEVGDEDVVQTSKSMLYMDARPSLHSRWLNQDRNRQILVRIIDERETPRPKIVLVEARPLPFLVDRINNFRCIEPFSPWA